MRILVLFTCFNRLDKTKQCITSLCNDDNIEFDFIVVDDSSTDGTYEYLTGLSNIDVIRGNGNSFYSGGMRIAINKAKKYDLSKFNYVMFINDDVNFDKGAIQQLVAYLNNREMIAVGAVRSDNGSLSYGGAKHVGGFRPKYKNVMSGKEDVYCDTFCANCVLIPSKVFSELENIDPKYHHAMGDFDYGWNASRNGVKILASNFFVGTCNDNPVDGTWKDTKLPRKVRLKKKSSIKGLPFGEYYHYLYKNHGFLTAVAYSIAPYVKILIGR